MIKSILSSLFLVALLCWSLPAVGQRQYRINAPPLINLNGFPNLSSNGVAFHDARKDSLWSMVLYNSTNNTTICINLYHEYQLSVVCSLSFPVANMAIGSNFATLVKEQTNANNYDLLSWATDYVGIANHRKLNFPGLTVPVLSNVAGTPRRGGEVALFPPGPFPLQAGLGDFGWYVVDDQLNYVYKRSIACGIPNRGASGGCFLDSGGMIYVGAATFTGTNQKYNVVVAADSASLNPTRVVRLRRANGGHLSLTKVSECSGGILFADLVQNEIVLVNHQLTQVLWAKRLPPQTPLHSVPIEGEVGILQGTMGIYTTIPWPGYPWGITDHDWAHFGLDMQTGNVVYGKKINSVNAPPFAEYNVIMPPFKLPDGQLREIHFLRDDYHSEWNVIDVDTLGYAGCDQLPFTPVFLNDTVVLDTIPAWTVDNVGAGTMSALPFPASSVLGYDSLDLECECDPHLAIVANPLSSYNYQFSLASSSYYGTVINWDFGDGSQATGNTPTHTFAGPGTYQVIACKDFFCGPRCDTIDLVVTACPLPTVAFTTVTSGNTAWFNSAGSQGTLLWQFGDGATSTVANPTHSYTTSGTYTVCLIATNFCTSDTLCQTVTLVCPLPTAVFTWTTNNLAATFNPTGTNTVVISWNFGDGSSVNNIWTPTHTYLLPGTYNVCLTAQNGCGPVTVCHTVTVTCPPPSPSFTYNAVNLNVAFNNTGGTGSYLWQFGDGITSTLASPTHTYAATGTYNVCLTVTTVCGVTTTCQSINVTCPNLPIAVFTSNATLLSATFNSSGSSGSLLWEFGDGGTSTAASPSHVYAAPGTYNVCLIATNSCGADTSCMPVTVTCPMPFAAFTSATSLLSATFNSAGSSGTLLWEFGDGGTSTSANPSHVYAAPGTYNVCLIATNSCGADTTCLPVTLTCPMPFSAFTSATSLLSATFNSSGSSGSLLWEFGDGGTSTSANPSHVYAAPGTYNVCLIATNSCGADTTCQLVTVTCPMPSAAFTMTTNLLSATFNSGGSSGSLLWEFGDGGTSTSANPSHAYAAPGTYNVCLFAMNSCGADTTCQLVTVTCPMPSAAFTSATNLLSATFSSNGSSGSLLWEFGDGGTSTSANPSHAYAAPGTYNVCLIATNSCGADTTCQLVTVTCPMPSAAFSFSANGLNYQFQNLSTGSSMLQSNWDFGDGGTSTAANPTHLYSNSGTYTVCLVIADSCGLDSTCQTTVALVSSDAIGFSVAIYPQPADERVEIRWSPLLGQLESLTVYGSEGKLLLTVGKDALQGQGYQIDTRLIAAGIYVLKLGIGGSFILRRVAIVH